MKKLDGKDLEKLRTANSNALGASRVLARATLARFEAEQVERQEAARAAEAERVLLSVQREAALRHGLDPDRPCRFNLETGEVDQ